MVKVRQDMTGWKMWEHGVPESRLIVIKQVEDYISPKGYSCAQWLCECSCEEHNQVIVRGNYLRSGQIKSCGCVSLITTIEMGHKNKKQNTYDLSGVYGIGWTTNTDREFYFDLEDYDKIKDCSWHEYIDKQGHSTLRTSIYNGKKEVSMHQLLGFWGGDHANRNPLDNRKENLRHCTREENARNYPLKKHNTSGFIGVSWSKDRNQWRAYININKKCTYLGCFINKIDAIKMRLEAEYKYYKEFAPQRHLFEEYGIISKGDTTE